MGPYGVPGSLSMGPYGVPGSRDSWTRGLGSRDSGTRDLGSRDSGTRDLGSRDLGTRAQGWGPGCQPKSVSVNWVAQVGTSGGLSNPFPSFYFRRTSAIYLAQNRIGNPLGFPRSHRILLDGRPAAGQPVSGQPVNHPSTNADELEIKRNT